ncbi:MAG: Ig domain-containing protein [Acidimicrobiales bacterium]
MGWQPTDDDTQSFTLTVNGLHVTTSSLPTLTEGAPYSQQLAAVGGVTPFAWKKVGKLPKGLSPSKSGLLSGTVKVGNVVPGNYTIEVQVTDATTPKPHQTATASFTLTVAS